MDEIRFTYANLFAILRSLGFQEKRDDQGMKPRHIFLHEQTDTILAFGREAAETVTPADVLSTEVHLSGRGITDESVRQLHEALPVNR